MSQIRAVFHSSINKPPVAQEACRATSEQRQELSPVHLMFEELEIAPPQGYEKMTPLELVLTVARHELVCCNNLIVTDVPELLGKAPDSEIKSKIDTNGAIALIDEFLSEFEHPKTCL